MSEKPIPQRPTPVVQTAHEQPRREREETHPLLRETNVLAIALYLMAQITEGQLARKLGVDRLEARERVAEFLNTAIENAGVPTERITTLETRLATTLSQVAALQLAREDLQRQLADGNDKQHDLRNEVQHCIFQIDELRQDLTAERGHLALMTRVVRYAHTLTGPECGDGYTAAELYRIAGEALGMEGD